MQTENRFDTDGGYFYYFENSYSELTDLVKELQEASEIGDDFNFTGPAFHGVMDFTFTSPEYIF